MFKPKQHGNLSHQSEERFQLLDSDFYNSNHPLRWGTFLYGPEYKFGGSIAYHVCGWSVKFICILTIAVLAVKVLTGNRNQTIRNTLLTNEKSPMVCLRLDHRKGNIDNRMDATLMALGHLKSIFLLTNLQCEIFLAVRKREHWGLSRYTFYSNASTSSPSCSRRTCRMPVKNEQMNISVHIIVKLSKVKG